MDLIRVLKDKTLDSFVYLFGSEQSAGMCAGGDGREQPADRICGVFCEDNLSDVESHV